MKPIRLVIGGSPCTHWSIAQKNGREVTAHGQGWELFENFTTAIERFSPDLFLYENNKSAAKPIKEQISHELGEPLQYINSALVSAQNRERFYCHNFGWVPQPTDRGIKLVDVIESGITWLDKAYTLDTNYWKTSGELLFENQSSRRKMVADPVIFNTPHGFNKGGIKYDKAPTLTANGSWETNNFVVQDKPLRIGTIGSDSQGYRVYSPYAKSITLCGNGGGMGVKTGLYAVPSSTDHKNVYEVRNGEIEIKGKIYPIKLPDGFYIIRKLTVTEACRLQTVPDDYCRAVSATQAYKGLGNGWTAEVIIHLLSYGLMGVSLDTPLEVISMYDGIGTGRYCLDKMGFTNVTYKAYEIDKYAMKIANSNYPDIIQMGDAFQVRSGI